jgi:hypothetical protein
MDKLKEHGLIQLRDARTGKVLAEAENLMVTSAMTLLAALLAGIPGVLPVSYLGIGTGTTTPVVGDTQLTAEYARAPVTSTSALAGAATIQTFFIRTASAVHIKELGLFGGAVTGAANSGTMFAHALLDYDNSAGTTDLVITWSPTLAIGS